MKVPNLLATQLILFECEPARGRLDAHRAVDWIVGLSVRWSSHLESSGPRRVRWGRFGPDRAWPSPSKGPAIWKVKGHLIL